MSDVTVEEAARWVAAPWASSAAADAIGAVYVRRGGECSHDEVRRWISVDPEEWQRAEIDLIAATGERR